MGIGPVGKALTYLVLSNVRTESQKVIVVLISGFQAHTNSQAAPSSLCGDCQPNDSTDWKFFNEKNLWDLKEQEHLSQHGRNHSSPKHIAFLFISAVFLPCFGCSCTPQALEKRCVGCSSIHMLPHLP